MRTLFYHKSKWQQWVTFLEGDIVKTHCSCPDFCIRKLERDEKNPQKINQIGFCKHLREILEEIDRIPKFLIKEGFK